MSEVIYMDKETRVAQVLAEVGEDAARNNPSAVYPALQAPDPGAERFRSLQFGSFEMKSASWVDVEGRLPEYDAERGWFNVGPAPELHIGGKTPKVLPDILRITHGLCCSMKAAAVMQAVDPEGVTVASVKLVVDGGARVEPYALVGVNRRIDIVNWAQAPVSLSYLDFANSWLASVKGKYGTRPDVDPSIHIVLSIGHMFSVELIEALRDAGVKGCYFVNEADRKTSHNL